MVPGAARVLLTAIVLGVSVVAADRPGSDLEPELYRLLTADLRFSTNDLAELEAGKAVKHTLPATSPGEVAAVGGIRVNAPKERFVTAYRDIVRFKRNPGVLQIGRFSNPPVLSDLDSLSITGDDVDLRDCRVGDCSVRLPAGDIHRLAKEVDWSKPDANAKAAALFKQMLFDNVRAYTAGGPGRMIQYDDDSTPVLPVEAFHALLKSSPYIDTAHPGLGAYLAGYPAEPMPGAEDFVYWSKEKFGFAPFISVTHVTLAPAGPHEYIATTRDVYSSRYFDASLALVIASDSVSDPHAFYLFYVNRSRASALRGAFARIRRSIVERRARGSLDENLRDIKQRLEQLGSN
jgi:hypothetical protein